MHDMSNTCMPCLAQGSTKETAELVFILLLCLTCRVSWGLSRCQVAGRSWQHPA